MFSVDSNFMNMALATKKVLDKYPELLKERKSLIKKISLMDAYIDGIQQNQVGAEPDSKGATESKGNAVDYAIELAMDLAGRASVFAEDKEDAVMKAKFEFPKKHFTNTQDALKVSRLRSLIEQLKGIDEDSESYDVTAHDIAELEKATDVFEKQLTNPRGVTVNRKNHNDNVKYFLMLLKKNMRSMDKLMSKLRSTELFKEYKIARKVIDLGTRKTQGRKMKTNKKPPIDKPDVQASTEG